MQMCARRATARAHLAEHVSALHDLALADADLRHMRITRGQPVAMVDFDHPAVTAVPAGGHDLALASRPDGAPGGNLEIEPRMHGRRLQERVAPDAEGGGDRVTWSRAVNRKQGGFFLDLFQPGQRVVQRPNARVECQPVVDRHQRAADAGSVRALLFADFEPGISQRI